MTAWTARASRRKRRALYLGLLAVQTLCVTILVLELMPFFWRLFDRLGEVQDFSQERETIACVCVALFQACYWWRLNNLGVPFATKSQLLSHLLMFVGRLSFIFGSALASLVFFRHFPMLDPAEVTLGSVFRLALFVAVLFSWFCFALELERLGKRQAR